MGTTTSKQATINDRERDRQTESACSVCDWLGQKMAESKELTLYNLDLSPFARIVRLSLAEKGILKTVTIRNVNVRGGEHLEPWFASLSPAMTVPVLSIERRGQESPMKFSATAVTSSTISRTSSAAGRLSWAARRRRRRGPSWTSAMR